MLVRVPREMLEIQKQSGYERVTKTVYNINNDCIWYK
jgi:hypothetical protein